MNELSKSQAIAKIDDLAGKRVPFLFMADYLGERNYVIPADKLDPSQILFEINGYSNHSLDSLHNPIDLKRSPISFEDYKIVFDQVHKELAVGNSYLTNLTFRTPIKMQATLMDVFAQSAARYKLWFRDEFVVYSPEIFVQIADGTISSFPMKGTIDANELDAESKILENTKEMAEHATIVDLIRNDISIFADNVRVEKFRYLDLVKTNHKQLLQVSSKIVGDLEADYYSKLGEIVYSLLPAGSICGAPKPRTLEIISKYEDYDRGFYTGVFGYFDGDKLDSGVMIRFIQKEGEEFYYKSGGGIHFLSDPAAEYQEMLDKVYVPIR